MANTPDILIHWPKGWRATFYGQTEKGKSLIKEVKSLFDWVVLLNSPSARCGLRPCDIASPDAWAADIWNWLEENGACVKSRHNLEVVYDEDGLPLAAFAYNENGLPLASTSLP